LIIASHGSRREAKTDVSRDAPTRPTHFISEVISV